MKLKHRVLPVILILLIGVAAPIRANPEDEKSTLIPRDVLFGNPQRVWVRISPDGKHICWLAPLDGVMNLWVAPTDNLDAAKPLTRQRGQRIAQPRWAFTNQHLIVLQDEAGRENFNVQVVDIVSGETRNLTPNPKISATIVEVSHKFPDEIVVGVNDRVPQLHDLHRINIRSGQGVLLMENPGTINGNAVANLLTDANYELRLAHTYCPNGDQEYFQPLQQPEKQDEVNGWESFLKVPFEDTRATKVREFDSSGNLLYLTDSRGRDKSVLVELNLKNGEMRVLAENDDCDVDLVLRHPRDGTVQAVSFFHLLREWNAIDPSLASDLEHLRRAVDAEPEPTSRSLDDRLWIVSCVADNAPVRFYLYNRDTREVKLLFSRHPELENLPLATMRPVLIKSRDGLDLVSYLTLPAGSDLDRDGKPEHPLPMVLLVHGGPWLRDFWGFDPERQWLANRGYAVLCVNYRGSLGFGKKYINAANREWGGKMHDDLLDAVNWAVSNGIAQKDKIAIMGASYGGYATLVGLSMTPDVFACGVDMVGPSKLRTLLENAPAQWSAELNDWKLRVGDFTTDEGRAFLDSRSPLTHVQNITKPLLICQGANDPRVKQSESDQIVKAMQQKNIPVTYVLYPDEGHNLNRPRNRISFFAVAEAFLAEHLGGKCEPIGSDLEGSSIQVPVGAVHIPGLKAALMSPATRERE